MSMHSLKEKKIVYGTLSTYSSMRFSFHKLQAQKIVTLTF